jgi:hypothetical protein
VATMINLLGRCLRFQSVNENIDTAKLLGMGMIVNVWHADISENDPIIINLRCESDFGALC